MKKKRLAALGMSAVLALSLVSCGASEPKTVAEMFDAYEEAIKDTGYSVEGTIAMGVSMTGGGMSFDIPIAMDYTGDFYNGNAHGEMGLSMSFMGQSVNSTVEYYIDESDGQVAQYSNTDGSGWTRLSEVNADFVASIDDKDIGTLEKIDDTYVATIAMDEVTSTDTFKDLFETMASSTGSTNTEEMAEMLGDAKMVYTFDAKTKQLKSLVMDEFECDITSAISTDPTMDGVEMSMTMAIDLQFSNYGGISADDVATPDEVKDSASETSDITLPGDDDLTPDDAPTSDGEPTDTDADVTPASGDAAFSFEGQALAFPFAYDTLRDAGWIAVDDGEYTFSVLKNAEYDAEIYAYDADWSGTEAGLISSGVYGISCDISGWEKWPVMSISGLTWGASDEDIKAALGEPDDAYEGEFGNTYVYVIKDSAAGLEYDIELRTDTGTGLSCIDIRASAI